MLFVITLLKKYYTIQKLNNEITNPNVTLNYIITDKLDAIKNIL